MRISVGVTGIAAFKKCSDVGNWAIAFAMRHWSQIEQGIFGTFIVSLISLLAMLYAGLPLV
jgi:hypothetical protein